MSYSKISSCPHCGAPIYVSTIWSGSYPPPLTYSCDCVKHPGLQKASNLQNPGFLSPPPYFPPPLLPMQTVKDTTRTDSQKAIEELIKAFEEVKKTNASEATKDPIKSLYDAFEENAMLKTATTNEDIMSKLDSLEKKILYILEKLKV